MILSGLPDLGSPVIDPALEQLTHSDVLVDGPVQDGAEPAGIGFLESGEVCRYGNEPLDHILEDHGGPVYFPTSFGVGIS